MHQERNNKPIKNLLQHRVVRERVLHFMNAKVYQRNDKMGRFVRRLWKLVLSHTNGTKNNISTANAINLKM
jgi:hypothetical protein